MVLLAVTVGAIASVAAALDGAGACGTPGSSGGVRAVDAECLQLVRTMSERMGAAVAAATAIVALTMVGLARTTVAGAGPRRGKLEE